MELSCVWKDVTGNRKLSPSCADGFGNASEHTLHLRVANRWSVAARHDLSVAGDEARSGFDSEDSESNKVPNLATRRIVSRLLSP